MKILSKELEPIVLGAAREAFPDLDAKILEKFVTLEKPADMAHGDFACPAPLRLAKILGIKPRAVADSILEKLPEDYRLESVKFADPGFINLKFSKEFLEEELKRLESGFSVEGGGKSDLPIIIEYSGTNAAKAMQVHHLITTVLGQSLSDLFEFMGYDVVRINHLGDWGTHFGKLIYAVETWGDRVEIERNPNDEFLRLYVKFNTEAEKNPELEDEARKIFKALEDGDELRKAMWEWMVKESMRDLEKVFVRLGVHFDHTMGESFYLKMADEILEDGKKRGLFIEGEGGSLIFNMGEGATPALIQKSDGTTLYLTRDIATVKYRVETWHPSAILYVVDHAQSLHFKQDFTISKALGYAEGSELEHVSFGRMSFADGAMSTRKGNVILVDKLLDEAVKRAGELAAAKSGDMPRAELERLREVVGIASIKYGILSQDRIKDLIFDWDKMITLEGNSAPYLLYSYARANSILSKAGADSANSSSLLTGLPKLSDPLEIDLIRTMLKFPEVLDDAVQERKPHMVATYLYELCQNFNYFYGKLRVLEGSEDEKRVRLGLVRAFMHQVKTGLTILGIPVLEKM